MKKFLNLSAVFLLLLCFAGVANAQDSGEVAVPAEKTEEPLNKKGNSADAINANTRNYYSDKIIVTATKTPVPLNETGSSISVITAEEIEQKGKKNVVDLLQDIPGVAVSRNGAFGGLSSIYIRGGDSGKVLVLIDGMRINDPMDIARGTNASLPFLTTDNIERIEVIKTPQSSLYGSDAQSIINIITKKGQGPTKVKLNFEAGSFNTFRESLNMSGGNDLVNYSLAIAREDSKGISKAENKSMGSKYPKKNSDYEKDGVNNTTILSKLNMPLSMGFDYTFSVYYQTGKFEYDGGAESDDPNTIGSVDTLTFNNVLTQKLFDWWSYKLEYGRTTVVRYDENKADAGSKYYGQSYYKGTTNQFEFKNDFKITDFDLFSLGYNLYTENGSSNYGGGPSDYFEEDWGSPGTYYPVSLDTASISFEESAKTNSFFIHNHLKLAKFLFHTVGVRYDRHEEFGGAYTWDTTLLFIAPVTDTRLKGAYAASFKAPTLYQLYADSLYAKGNRDLDPEKGKHYEIGIEQPLFSDIVKIGLTYFNNRYKDKIDFNSATITYENIEGTESKGYESFIDLRLPLDMTLGASYTYTETKDKKTGDELLKRPKHKANAVLNWNFLEGANLNIVYNYIGKRYDIKSSDYDPVTWDVVTVYGKLDSYSTVDLKLSYWINQFIQAYGRVENVGNKKYQQANGYAMPERAFYAGVEGHLI